MSCGGPARASSSPVRSTAAGRHWTWVGPQSSGPLPKPLSSARRAWRWSPRRLEAEAVRDAMLAVSGELDRRAGGASDQDGKKSFRRSLYLFQRRGQAPAFQPLFDGPNAVPESCARRHVSTVPLQALYLLNNHFAFQRAKAFARRVQALAGADRERPAAAGCALAPERAPDGADRPAGRPFLAGPGSE